MSADALAEALAAADELKADLQSKAAGINKTGIVLMPGETEAQGRLRRVKMHEFLMTGGIVESTKDGHVTYSKPLTVLDALGIPECPWHGANCDAWILIRKGEGHWTKLESELDALDEILSQKTAAGKEKPSKEQWDRYNELRDELSLRPKSLNETRERSEEQIKADKRAALKKQNAELNDRTGGVYAAAGPKGPGNPWDKKPQSTSTGTYKPNWKPKPVQKDDARDDAVAAFALGDAIPDTIEIEGDEDDE